VTGDSGDGATGGWPEEPPRRVWMVVLVVGVLLAALVAAIVLSGGDGETASPSAPPTTDVPAALASTTSAAAGSTESTLVPLDETATVEVVGTPLPGFATGTEPSTDPGVGQVAPAVVGSDFTGAPVAIDPTNGTGKAIVFLAHWCPHCQAEVPRVQEWLDGGGGVPGVEIMAVSTAVRADEDNYPPSAWLDREGWTSPVIRDSEESDALFAYGAGAFPYWVFVDEQGTVVRRTAGELDIASLEQYMTETLGVGAAAAPPSDYTGFRAQPTACGADAPPEAVEMTFDVPQDMGIDPASAPEATIATSCGELVVELDPAAAPATVNSFVFLAESGYFDGTAAHRVVPGFVVQMGDPTGTGTGSPGYVIPDELPAPGTVYATGTLAMANAGPGTSGSQFFVTLSDVGLPADYSIFGRVVDSADTLDAISGVPLGPNVQGEVSVPLETVYIESVTIER
jgi:cyclophilin family peptidyl-prolyl cis-trans isomerase